MVLFCGLSLFLSLSLTLHLFAYLLKPTQVNASFLYLPLFTSKEKKNPVYSITPSNTAFSVSFSVFYNLLVCWADPIRHDRPSISSPTYFSWYLYLLNPLPQPRFHCCCYDVQRSISSFTYGLIIILRKSLVPPHSPPLPI